MNGDSPAIRRPIGRENSLFTVKCPLPGVQKNLLLFDSLSRHRTMSTGMSALPKFPRLGGASIGRRANLRRSSEAPTRLPLCGEKEIVWEARIGETSLRG